MTINLAGREIEWAYSSQSHAPVFRHRPDRRLLHPLAMPTHHGPREVMECRQYFGVARSAVMFEEKLQFCDGQDMLASFATTLIVAPWQPPAILPRPTQHGRTNTITDAPAPRRQRHP